MVTEQLYERKIPLHVVVATYFYYEKVGRMMRFVIVSNLL